MSAKAKPTVVRMVPIRKVEVPKRKRIVRSLEELTSSIAALGLLNPITVTKHLVLVSGLHRLRACEALGWKDIPAIVLSLNQLDAELAEIDENLCRTELTALERSKQTARRKAIYEARHPETKAGTAGARAKHSKRLGEAANATVAFAENTAAQTGKSRRSVEQDAQIGDGIAPEVQDAIRDSPLADKKRELIELAQVEDPAQQAQVADLVVSGKARTVAEAQEQLSSDIQRGVVRDELGAAIPDPGIVEVFTILRPRMLEVVSHIRSGRRSWGRFHEEQEAGKRVRILAGRSYTTLRDNIEHELKRVGSLIHAAVPYAVCPYCHGAPLAKEQSKWCEGCRGGGWVDRGTYDAAPPEMKAPAAKGVSHGR